MDVINYFNYNSFVVLTFFFVSFLVLIINYISKGKSNKLLFSSYKSNIFSIFTYIRLITHVFGHASWQHFMNNFLYILLIGPMIEEKYGSINLIYMIVINALITGILNNIFTNKRILGASGIVFMFIVLSSFVNIVEGKIPITFVLVCIFYIVNEIISGVFKKDDISHVGHLIGALFGFIFGFYIFK